MKSLGQVKTIYPQAFDYHYENNVPGDCQLRSKYQLIVESNIEENGPGHSFDKKSSHMTTANLVCRRKIFNSSLHSTVMGYHRTFLAALAPPLEIADDKVFRWHHEFSLDSVPEIEEGDLPAPPASLGGHPITAVLKSFHHSSLSSFSLSVCLVFCLLSFILFYFFLFFI